MKLYNGKNLAGFTKDNIRELRDEAPREARFGFSGKTFVEHACDDQPEYPVAEKFEPFVGLDVLRGLFEIGAVEQRLFKLRGVLEGDAKTLRQLACRT